MVADPLSRLDFQDETEALVSSPHPHYPEILCAEILNLEEEEFPLCLSVINRHQQNNGPTRLLAKEKGFKKILIDQMPLIVTAEDKIVIPDSHKEAVLNWYHYFLNHPGESRMDLTIRKKLYWRGMTGDIKHFVKTCNTCKKFKKSRQKYGKLPLKDVKQETIPWDVVQIDTIGPYTITSNTGKDLHLSCKTMIDPATGWFEIIEMKDTNNSADAARIFNNTWLSRYPRPKRVIMDNGSEFKNILNLY